MLWEEINSFPRWLSRHFGTIYYFLPILILLGPDQSQPANDDVQNSRSNINLTLLEQQVGKLGALFSKGLSFCWMFDCQLLVIFQWFTIFVTSRKLNVGFIGSIMRAWFASNNVCKYILTTQNLFCMKKTIFHQVYLISLAGHNRWGHVANIPKCQDYQNLQHFASKPSLDSWAPI